jgi:tripartite ATP-independent transporter DctM subunit
MVISTALLITFFVLVLLGVPITFSIGIATLVGFIIGGYPLQVVGQIISVGVQSFTLLAIAFFLLAGNIMNDMGLTEKIFGFARALVGHIKGGLGHVNILASMIFAGISGSATADCAALGVIEMKAMNEAGYRKPFSAAITLASSTVGPVIPPSIGFIIYAVIARVSVAELFVAGLIPGLLMGLGLMAMVYYLNVSGREICPVERRKTIKEILITLRGSFLAIIAPIIILFGMVGGIVTPTEAGLLAVVYSLIVAVIYRKFSFSKLPKILIDTVLTTSYIFILIAIAKVMGYLIIHERMPYLIANAMISISTDRLVILSMISVFLLIVGCIMSGTAILIILIPIFIPVVSRVGVDLVYFGVLQEIASVIGIITPPVGIGLYVVAEIAHLPIEVVVKAVIPFLLCLILVLLTLIFFPQMALFLPNLIF